MFRWLALSSGPGPVVRPKPALEPSQPYGEYDPRSGESIVEYRDRIAEERAVVAMSDDRPLVLHWEIAQLERAVKGHEASLEYARSQLDAGHDLSPFWAARIESDLAAIRDAEAGIVAREAEIARMWPWLPDQVAYSRRGTQVILVKGQPTWDPSFWDCRINEGPSRGDIRVLRTAEMRRVRPFSKYDPANSRSCLL